MTAGGGRLLRGEPTTPIPPHWIPGDVASLSPLLLAAGVTLLFIGLLDVVLLWLPPDLFDADWRFVIIAESFGALLTPSLGLVCIGLAALARGEPRWPLKVAAVLFAVGALVLLVWTATFLHDLPGAWRGIVNESVAPGLKRRVSHTLVRIVGYVPLYLNGAWLTWRVAKPEARPWL